MRSWLVLLSVFGAVLWGGGRLSGQQLKLSQEVVEGRMAQTIRYDPKGPNRVGHLFLGRGGINQSTWIYVKQALDHYQRLEPKPIFLILELNSPGGEVFAAEEISKMLVDIDVHSGIPVVALIDNWALSAGALLAYSSRFIATAKDGAMGAAQPVLMGQEGMRPAGEKITSALRADFASRAGYFDRNSELAEAMVDADLILVVRDGGILSLQSEQEIRTEEPNPDEVITTKGKLLTLTGSEMIEYGVADFMVPVTPVPAITEAERRAGQWPATKSLLWTYPFFQKIPNAVIDAYQVDWKVQFFSFLANPAVSSILFLLMMLGFYIELSTPGFGIPGTVGLIALIFIVLSSFAMQALGWLELILLLAGALLLVLEVFILPGFGIAGIMGIALMIVGIVAMLLPGLGEIDFSQSSETLSVAMHEVLVRLAWLGGAILVGGIIIALLSRYLVPKFPGFRRLVLTKEQEGYVAGPTLEQLPPIGSKGVTITPLRPGGKVRIGEEVYDASSQGIFLDAETEITVTEYLGRHMIVQKTEKT